MGESVLVTISTADADGDTLTFQLLNAPSSVTLSNPVISIAPTHQDISEVTLIVRVQDDFGGVVSQQFIVSVVDLNGPVATAPTNLTVSATATSGTAVTDSAIAAFLMKATATDDVDGPIATVTHNAPATFPLGVTTVTFSATDKAVNTGSAQATVTVLMHTQTEIMME